MPKRMTLAQLSRIVDEQEAINSDKFDRLFQRVEQLEAYVQTIATTTADYSKGLNVMLTAVSDMLRPVIRETDERRALAQASAQRRARKE